jgi:hypothetical protein
VSKADILSELPNLNVRERAEIFAKLCELEDLIPIPTAAERALLAKEWEDFRNDSNPGSPAHEVEARLRRGLEK